MKLIRSEVDSLCKDIIDNCDLWTQTEHTFNRDSGSLKIWTSNIPVIDIDLYPSASAFNIFEKVRIKRAIAKSRIRKAINKQIN